MTIWRPRPLIWAILTVANLILTAIWGDTLADWLIVVTMAYITLLEWRIQRLQQEAREKPLWPV